MVLCGSLEYATSFIMEKAFNARWWDYSEMRFNINGRVCLETLVPFGIAGLLIVYLFNPFLASAVLIDTYYESSHKGYGNSRFLLSSIVGNYTNNNISHALKEINNSIVIINGEAEPLKEETKENYLKYNPAIEHFNISKTKHLPQLENPNSLLEILNICI